MMLTGVMGGREVVRRRGIGIERGVGAGRDGGRGTETMTDDLEEEG